MLWDVNKLWTTFPPGPCELFLSWRCARPPRMDNNHEHLPWIAVSNKQLTQYYVLMMIVLLACGTCMLIWLVSPSTTPSPFRGSFGDPSDKNHHYHIEPLNKLDASVRRQCMGYDYVKLLHWVFHVPHKLPCNAWSSFSTHYTCTRIVHWHSTQTEHVVKFLCATCTRVVVRWHSIQTKVYVLWATIWNLENLKPTKICCSTLFS